MPFVKGHKKTGGRRAGTPNKKTGLLRNFITTFLSKEQDGFYADYKRLLPDQRVRTYVSLLEFATPKYQRIELPIIKEEDKKIEVIFRKARPQHMQNNDQRLIAHKTHNGLPDVELKNFDLHKPKLFE